MTEAEQDLADLDAELAASGEPIELQRLIGTQLIPIRCPCRAFVRKLGATELIASITQDQSEVIISPTEIIRRGWPGPEVVRVGATPPQVPTAQDRRVPIKGDKTVVAGKALNVEVAKPKYVDGMLVRIMMLATG